MFSIFSVHTRLFKFYVFHFPFSIVRHVNKYLAKIWQVVLSIGRKTLNICKMTPFSFSVTECYDDDKNVAT